VKISLRKITSDDKKNIEDLKQEIQNYDGDYEGFSILSNLQDYSEFYKMVISNEKPVNINYSPQFTYLAFDENNNLVGVTVLRTELKGELVNYGGNVGYLVRPSKRRRGYGSKILEESLKILKEKYNVDFVVLGCRIDNIGSSKVIENNGGIYSNNFFEEKNGKMFKKYTKKL